MSLWKFDYEFDRERLLKEASADVHDRYHIPADNTTYFSSDSVDISPRDKSLPVKYDKAIGIPKIQWKHLSVSGALDHSYAPFTDVGNCSNEKFVEWLEKNKESSPKVAKFYDELRVHVKNANKSCPYALELAKYFIDLVGDDAWPRFYYQKKGFKLRLHTDRGTQCSINFVLTEDPDPIYFENDEQVYYKVALLNTSELHGVIATKDRYLFKLSFSDTSFEKVKDVLSSHITECYGHISLQR